MSNLTKVRLLIDSLAGLHCSTIAGATTMVFHSMGLREHHPVEVTLLPLRNEEKFTELCEQKENQHSIRDLTSGIEGTNLQCKSDNQLPARHALAPVDLVDHGAAARAARPVLAGGEPGQHAPLSFAAAAVALVPRLLALQAEGAGAGGALRLGHRAVVGGVQHHQLAAVPGHRARAGPTARSHSATHHASNTSMSTSFLHASGCMAAPPRHPGAGQGTGTAPAATRPSMYRTRHSMQNSWAQPAPAPAPARNRSSSSLGSMQMPQQNQPISSSVSGATRERDDDGPGTEPRISSCRYASSEAGAGAACAPAAFAMG
ncbi:LOW QUALITY PROTEIN: hypothetical protein U9M48_014486 [Paspalum notatum var. saurae]|uniref:Uncharacterized protein n=1 Tax=Paspalum notatum var. saurae TaxID=547442 RepID=A0AAQ3WKX4_PASNO